MCSTDSLILLSLVRLTSGFWLEFGLVSGILLLVEDGCLLGGVTLGMCGISCDAQFCDHFLMKYWNPFSGGYTRPEGCTD